MSKDKSVTEDLIETLEDGREGFAKGADKLDDSKAPDLAMTFRRLSDQRDRFAKELQDLATAYGDGVDDSGTITASIHRGWMSLKDALSGSDPDGVLDVAEQGEDHAKKKYENALQEDISAGLRTVVQRQYADVQAAHDEVRSLREAFKR